MSHSYNYPPQMAYPSAPPVYRAFPAPPRLHWAWVLVLSIVTFGIFWTVWLVVQARWVRKATGNARAFAWSVAYALYLPSIILGTFAGSFFLFITNRGELVPGFTRHMGDLVRVFGFLLYVAAVYMLKSGLESEPIRIPLHGLGVFFFGPVYFQYYLRNYSVEGRLGEQLSGFEEAAVAEVPEAPPQS